MTIPARESCCAEWHNTSRGGSERALLDYGKKIVIFELRVSAGMSSGDIPDASSSRIIATVSRDRGTTG